MSRALSMTIPHDLGVAEAKRRINERFATMKTEYVDKIGQADVTWVDDVAHLRVVALGQTVTAEVAVMPAEVKIDVLLPWLLAAMANKVQGLMQTNAEKTLRLGKPKKV